MSVLAIVLIGYGVVALLTLRPVAGHFAWSFLANGGFSLRGNRPDGGQWFGACLCALGVACVWPIGVLWILVGWRGPVIGAERQAQIKAQEKRIRQLERELEIAAR